MFISGREAGGGGANLMVSVRGDTVPELDKTYTVVLTAASLVGVYIRERGGGG